VAPVYLFDQVLKIEHRCQGFFIDESLKIGFAIF